MDWLTLAEFLSPLLVALFAVWLGYWYERRLRDRHVMRKSYLRTRSALAALILCVERSERLSFAADLMRQAEALKTTDVDGAVRLEINAVSVVLNVGTGLGIAPDRGAYRPDRPWGEWDAAGPDLAQAHLLIQRDFNAALHQIDEEEAMMLFGGLSTCGENYRPIQQGVQELAAMLTGFQQSLTPDKPAAVDWKAVFDSMLTIQNAMALDLGGDPTLVRGHIRHGQTAKWPPGTPVIALRPGYDQEATVGSPREQG